MSFSTTIEVQLLSGRYHAHVWGESQFGMAGPEWPPSPWRLLRALAAAWFAARPDGPSAQDRDELLETLGRSGPPELWLPKTSFHELPYYQPIWEMERGFPRYERRLHYDHFAVPEGGRFWFRFNTPLSERQQRLLTYLFTRIRYFGRSESRAYLRTADIEAPPEGIYRVFPRDAAKPNEDYVCRRVLCTTPDFKASDLWQVRGDNLGSSGAPPHLVDSLIERRMPLPCGTRSVEYAVPNDSLVSEIRPRRARAAEPRSTVEIAEIRFRLGRRIPIPVSLLVALSRAFRDAAVRQYERIAPNRHSRILTGREPDGTVARGHQHAYYLPQVKTDSGTIEHFAVVVPSGRMTREELEALLSVRRIPLGESDYPVTPVVEELVKTRSDQERVRRWRSVTPFLLPVRHGWEGRLTTLDERLGWWIERLCGVRLLELSRMVGHSGSGWVVPVLAHDYLKRRSRVGRSWRLTRRPGFWLEVTFAEPVALRVPIGADAHFGAGQFVPVGN